MNADKDNTGEGSKSSSEDAIRKRARRLMQTCDEWDKQKTQRPTCRTQNRAC